MTSCPSQPEIAQLATGEVEEARAAELFEHIEHCSTCAKHFELQLRDHSDSLASIEAPDVPPSLQAALAAIRPTSESTETPTSTHESKFDVADKHVIDKYQLLEQIGRGGMGVVYLAQQQQPVKRRVALKLIKPGMDSREVIKRFEAERQVLALMDHPNIAKVFDAGETSDGRPFFVMEYVSGVPIHKYCDNKKMPAAERLELFQDVCMAVQHAHQKGVIHRDIKPSNILVSTSNDRPVIKVIDFGVAKAMHQTAAGTVYTKLSQLIGTPLYMSPEQADMSSVDIDTRTDIYSLGVLLYELLTGETPFDRDRLQNAAFDEMRRIIREEEPPSPSIRISSLGNSGTNQSSLRCADPKQLSRQLRGELDWIVMKSLEKDRARRYDTAAAFAEDISRFLANEAVLASPPSKAYKLKKFIHRNVRTVIVTAAMMLLLVLGVVGTSLGWANAIEANRDLDVALADANKQRELASAAAQQSALDASRAKQQTAIAEAVNEFLNEDLLSSVSPSSEPGRGREVKMLDVLLEAENRIDDECQGDGKFVDMPLVEAGVRRTLGRTLTRLGEHQRAATQLERALELHTQHSPQSQILFLTASDLGGCYRAARKDDKAEEILKDYLAQSRNVLGNDDIATVTLCSDLAQLYKHQWKPDLALPLLEEAIQGFERVYGPDVRATLYARVDYANVLRRKGQYEKALEMLLVIEADALKTFAENDTITISILNTLADVQKRANMPEESLKNRLRALAGFRQLYGDNHPSTLVLVSNVGVDYTMSENYIEAEKYLREAAESRQRVLGKEHSDSLFSQCYLALNLSFQKKPEALTLASEAVSIAREAYPDDNVNIGDCMAWQGRVMHNLQMFEEGAAVLEESYTRLVASVGEDHSFTYNALKNAIDLYDDWLETPDHPDLDQRNAVWRERYDAYMKRKDLRRAEAKSP